MSGWSKKEGDNLYFIDDTRGYQIYGSGVVSVPYDNKYANSAFTETYGLDGFSDTCMDEPKIIFDGENCCYDWFVTWFNGGDNKSYAKVLDNDNDFNIKNIDDEMQIIKIDNEYGFNHGLQTFSTNGYTDKGSPNIREYKTLGVDCGKYGGQTTGHKIKYVVDDNNSTTRSLVTNTITNCSDLVEMYIPHYYTTIEQGAFSANTRLSAVTFNGVEYVRASAFEGCSNLKYVDFSYVCGSNEINNCLRDAGCKLKYIGDNAFKDCMIQRVETEENVPIIDGVAATFNVIDLSCHTSLVYIGDEAFAGQNQNCRVIKLPSKTSGCLIIGDSAFTRNDLMVFIAGSTRAAATPDDYRGIYLETSNSLPSNTDVILDCTYQENYNDYPDWVKTYNDVWGSYGFEFYCYNSSERRYKKLW